PGQAGLVLNNMPGKLGGVDWLKANYLVFDVLIHEEWSVGLNVGFWEESNLTELANLVFTIGVLPGVKTTIAIPLSELNSQRMFQGRTPGRLKTVIHGNKVDLALVNKVWIGVQRSSFTQKLAITNLHLSVAEPEYPLAEIKLVDEFGQWTQKDWPGKIHSEAELLSQLQPLIAKEQVSNFPADWSSYGGWTGRKFEATGYFRTQKDGEQWWLVDPEGNVFYSNGLDCIRPDEGCPVDGMEKLFTWLPEKDGLYQEAWRENTWVQPSSTINFAAVNLIRAFGENWWEAWTKLTRNWLIEWGFNTVGNWSSERFSHESKLPYVWPLENFPQTRSLIFRDFPDVFSDEYQENAEHFASQLCRFKDDPYLIGYFLRNEPEWAFVEGLIIAEELLENQHDFASKQALLAFLEQRYNGEISLLNQAWNTTFLRFDQLNGGVKKAASFSEQARLDLRAFSREMIARYVRLPSEAAKAVDPHHLNLGMRYAYLTDEDLLAGCEHFDVFSINCYKFDPTPQIEVVGRLTGLPVMIGEYHFGALDKGLTATGLKGVSSQKERGKAYSLYSEHAAASPYCVGAHYFILSDQAALGRFDGENYQIGLVNVCHQPYKAMLHYVTETNRTIYQVASGEREPFNEQPDEIEFIAF
ncbi:MAG: beta-galactosidase, partial [Gorillibacterium sp.]|nr:beta-galactosidase [Gorillibacterium sp.]